MCALKFYQEGNRSVVLMMLLTYLVLMLFNDTLSGSGAHLDLFNELKFNLIVLEKFI